ncbi:hypothetical protein [Simiduia agarivorans]|uniref:Lipoprotein n=1 Tax=Simiduia agarivorans (strain DSM 21679 / JCM 13881 / BCRC 17597 / SA1) TaxID=1117647 RepID=K4KR49_SIMAS|nr:hypothetical protein [Simiduia agarivorans]AFV00736.1 hypothetical protein M5M_18035 [Simiduia agarivorans SA1 = DSM 21679]
MTKLTPFVSLCSSVVLLAACGGGGGSQTITEPQPVTQPETPSVVRTTESLVLPESLEVVSATGASANSFTRMAKKGLMFSMAGFDDAGTDYSNSRQHVHTWVEALEPVEMVNSILCFAGKLKATEFVNAGPYLALVDESQCFDEEGEETQLGDNGQVQSKDTSKRFINAVVDATRSGDTEPLIVEAWIKDVAGEGPDGPMSIKMRAVITEGASETNPYGQFSFTWQMVDNLTNTQANFGSGEIQTVNTLEGFIGFTLYEANGVESETFSYSREQQASVVMRNDLSDGVALTGFYEQNPFYEGGASYGLSFDNDRVLIQQADSFADLPYRTGDVGAGSCLSRTDFVENVWRYDLFDANTGAAVRINSGFPVQIDTDGNGVFDQHGYVGYHGLWADGEASFADGTQMQRGHMGDSNSSSEIYTLNTAPGRLVQYSMETLPLAELRGSELMYWDQEAQSAGFDQWVVQYLTANADQVGADGFYLVAGMRWGDQGPAQRTALEQPVMISPQSDWDIFHFWSQQLGGQVRYKPGAAGVKFYRETVINGAESELFANGALELVCLNDCPVGSITENTLGDWHEVNSPMVQPESINAAPAFSFANSGDAALTLVRSDNGESVTFASTLSRASLEAAGSTWAWGLRSGALVTAADAALLTNTWDIWGSESVQTYYQWETGFDQWQKLVTLVDATGQRVQFDQPLSLTYRHNTSQDRNNSSAADGQVFQINYGGRGDFWGIPHRQDGDRWSPMFSIADGVTLGDASQYVIKAIDIERQMADAPNSCSALAVNDPAAPLPEGVSGNADIGSMPSVTGGASVIDGEVQ